MFSEIISIFNIILYQPLFNILVWFYNIVPPYDLGVSIILLTLLTRLILLPFSYKATKSQIISQQTMASLQPKIQEVKRKHKEDKVKQSQALMELYRKNKFNPFSGCLILLIQFPILIALYQVFWKGLDPAQLSNLYSFIRNPGVLEPMFLGILDVSKSSPVLAVLAGFLQFLQTKMIMPKSQKSKKKEGQIQDMTRMMQKQMTYFMPILLVFIFWRLPSALPLYIIITILFSIVQQYFINKTLKKQPIIKYEAVNLKNH